ncbi:MAG: MotA/TolQ/ExbB proton channel family protein [Kiritimatiellae bacterium]|nr:MotA/TolQ/ExbB proton channel family protein [Kiritimatiellia bacterium]
MTAFFMGGGPVSAIICLLGAGSLLLFFVRLADLRRAHVDWVDFIRGVANVLAKGNADEALAICEDTPSPVARVVAAAVTHRGEDAAALRDVVASASRAEVRRLARRLAALPVVAQVAPLLGLFGTVLGFSKMLLALKASAPLARADLLAGLAPALSAAAAGLLVAVVAHVAHALLRARLDRIVAELDDASAEIRVVVAACAKRAAEGEEDVAR